MIHEQTIDGDRVLTRRLVVAAVENPSVGDWSAYVIDLDTVTDDETPEESAARVGDKLSESEAARYFRGPQCPRGPYRG